MFRGIVTEIRGAGDITDVVVRDILDASESGLRLALHSGLETAALEGAQRGNDQVMEILGVSATGANSEKRARVKLGIEVGAFDQAAEAAAKWARAYSAPLISQVTDTTRRQITAIVANWIEKGETRRKLIDRIADVRTEPGKQKLFSSVRAEMIAVTETTRAYTQGNIISLRETGVVKKMMWRTSNDERVCPICAPLGGLPFAADGAQPTSLERQRTRGATSGLDSLSFTHPGGRGIAGDFRGQTFSGPPAHIRCRCWLAPVV